MRVRLPLGGRTTPCSSAIAPSTPIRDKRSFTSSIATTSSRNALVKLGGLHDGLREIESGLKAKEQIVIEGIQRVRLDHGDAGTGRDARRKVINVFHR